MNLDNENEKQRNLKELPCNSSEDELLASSQETTVDLPGIGGTRQSTPVSQQTKTKSTTKGGNVVADIPPEKKPKKKSPAEARKALYQKAKFILAKIAKNELSGKVHEHDAADKIKYTAIVEEYEKNRPSQLDTRVPPAKRNRSQAEDDRSSKKRKENTLPMPSTSTRRPFNEVVKDDLLVALGNDKSGTLQPVTSEWSNIEPKLTEQVMEYVLNNKGSTVPRFDSGEIHRGFRVIKCMDGPSKEFLFKCIAKLRNAFEGLSLVLIPAKDIPMRPRARVWLPKTEMGNSRVLELLRAQNPSVPMDDWSVIKIETTKGNVMSALLAITEEGAAAVEKLDSKLFFGVREAKVKIFRPQQGPDGNVDEEDIENAELLLDKLQLKGPSTSKQ